ncbi:unnamed protein product [Linum tenue]|uniref:Uncharacterized protein n=1 Tax=Linum tenue TaxID=586396 RepID=A0AAV0LCB3_9ROSI|nr:unnamed protein product [Linum tenue]
MKVVGQAPGRKRGRSEDEVGNKHANSFSFFDQAPSSRLCLNSHHYYRNFLSH